MKKIHTGEYEANRNAPIMSRLSKVPHLKGFRHCLAILTVSLMTITASYGQCFYSLELLDSFGDGWNDNAIDVSVNSVLTNYTLHGGSDTLIPILVSTGDSIEIAFLDTGSFVGEVSFVLYDADNVIQYSSGTSPFNGIHVDTTAICPLCPPPGNIVLDSLTTSALYVSWQSVASAGGYYIEWGPCGFTPGTGASAIQTTNTVAATGLSEATCYEFYLTSDCSSTGNGFSTTVGPISFITAQGIVDTFPFVADFESGSDGFITGGQNSSWELGVPLGSIINTAASGSNAWVTNLDGNYNDDEHSYLRSPVFDFSNEVEPVRLSFDLQYITESCCDEGYLEVTYDGMVWHRVVANASATGWFNDLSNDWWDGTDTVWSNRSILIDSLSGKSYVQFRFNFDSDGSVNREGFAVDNFNIEVLNCTMPSAVTFSTLTDTSVVVSWSTTAGGTNIEWGPLGFTPGTGVLYNVSNPFTITGLDQGTTYQIYLQDSCNVGVIGLWTTPYTFTTLQEVVNTFPYVEDFDTDNGGWLSGGIASSWEYGTPAGTVIAAASTGINAWVTNLDGDYNNNENSYLQSVIFDASGLQNDIEYAFDMIFETESCCDEGWIEYTFDGVTWTKLTDFGRASNWYTNTGSQWWNGTNTAWTRSSNIIPGSAGQSFVQIRHVFNSDLSVLREGFGIDGVSVTELPCPYSFDLGIDTVTTTTATVFWTSSGSGWDVEWGPVGFTPGTSIGTIVSTNNDTVQITGLTPLTCYDYYVLDSCSTGGVGIPSGPFMFCTMATCPIPTDLGVSQITDSSAVLTWDGNNVPGNYFVEYGIEGFTPGTGVFNSSTADSLMVTNLSPAAEYCFYIWEICTPGDTSLVAGPYCFFTECGMFAGDDMSNPIIATAQLFTYNTNTSICYTDEPSSPRGSVDAYVRYTPSVPGVTTTFETCGSGYDTFIFLLDSAGNTLVSNDDNCGLQSSITGYPVVYGQDYYMLIEAFSSSSSGSLTITITENTPCPMPVNFALDSVTCMDAGLSWSYNSASTGAILEYGFGGFTPGTGTTINTSDSSIVLTGLTPGQNYDAYLTGICGADTAFPTGPLSFSTLPGTAVSASGSFTIASVTGTDATVNFDGSASVGYDSLMWDFGDPSNPGPFAVGTNVSHSYTNNGTYYVTLYAVGCSVDTMVITVVVEGISIEESDLSQISIFPNPSTGAVMVDYTSVQAKNAILKVTDLNGRNLYAFPIDLSTSTRKKSLDLSHLPRGVYLIHWMSDRAVQVERIVLQ